MPISAAATALSPTPLISQLGQFLLSVLWFEFLMFCLSSLQIGLSHSLGHSDFTTEEKQAAPAPACMTTAFLMALFARRQVEHLFLKHLPFGHS